MRLWAELIAKGGLQSEGEGIREVFRLARKTLEEADSGGEHEENFDRATATEIEESEMKRTKEDAEAEKRLINAA